GGQVCQMARRPGLAQPGNVWHDLGPARPGQGGAPAGRARPAPPASATGWLTGYHAGVPISFAPTPSRSGTSNTEKAIAKAPATAGGECMREPYEQRLLSDLRAGRPEACAELVRGHYQRVYRFLLHLARDVHQAEDLTQETFAAAWERIAAFQ